MSSRRFGGIRFVAYPEDHEPRHIHAFIAGAEVILDISADRSATVAERADAVRGATRSEVRKVIGVAQANVAALIELWEAMHS